ncbi:MAG: putative inorganic carbon transporter subunit DabA, partial [Planctomycetota bacterium]
LDCGACGGHSGEPNAKFAAMLLNRDDVRSGLSERGIELTEETRFVAAVHNTTTDGIEIFDEDQMPEAFQSELGRLNDICEVAGAKTRRERTPLLGAESPSDLRQRAADWSEVRPEWGLAGNAAFIIGPRSMTRDLDLNGRSFLHSYDQRSDPQGAVLETIMTAPMVVAHWINMQYFASTVDNRHFGSGDKTIHNVVGGFGVLSGNSGDLMTGLPIQSLHDGKAHVHVPLRLHVVIAATRTAIDAILGRHENIKELVDNEWLHLIAVDGDEVYRYGDQAWHRLSA